MGEYKLPRFGVESLRIEVLNGSQIQRHKLAIRKRNNLALIPIYLAVIEQKAAKDYFISCKSESYKCIQNSQTQTQTNTNPNGTEANAAGRSGNARALRKQS